MAEGGYENNTGEWAGKAGRQRKQRLTESRKAQEMDRKEKPGNNLLRLHGRR